MSFRIVPSNSRPPPPPPAPSDIDTIMKGIKAGAPAAARPAAPSQPQHQQAVGGGFVIRSVPGADEC